MNEQPKQETLEEAAERILLLEDLDLSDYDKRHILNAMVNIAKWQQQQNKNLYSEEEVYQKIHNLMTSIKLNGLIINDDIDLKQWFNKNKKQ